MLLYQNFLLAPLTSFQIGGTVRYFFQPRCLEECLQALDFVKNENLSYFVLGVGSNVVVGSKPYEGAVISTLKLNALSLHENIIHAEAGVINSDLALFALEYELAGFEFLYGMPGSLGGSAVMNSRAFGSSLSDRVLAVDVIDEDLQQYTLDKTQLCYAYKSSIFHSKRYFITKIFLQGKKGRRQEIRAQMEENQQKRLATKQHDFPNAGCIFKNQYSLGVSSGQLIDSLGLKGARRGNAEIYNHHANFIINRGGASSHEVLELIHFIKETVRQERSVQLECEVQFVGNHQ